MRGEILKITLGKHLKSLLPVFILIIGDFAISFLEIPNELRELFIFVLIFYALWSLPAIVLHIDYYLRNKNTEYEILSDRMIVRKRRNEIIYLKSDIKEIYVNVSDWWWTARMSFVFYNYARIDMKNGESIYLTSLLFPRKAEEIVKKYFAGVPYYKIKRWYCTTHWKSHHEECKKDNDIDFYGLYKDEGIDEAARHRMKNANWKFEETSKMNKTTCSESKI